jgi:hypothetical protein
MYCQYSSKEYRLLLSFILSRQHLYARYPLRMLKAEEMALKKSGFKATLLFAQDHVMQS